MVALSTSDACRRLTMSSVSMPLTATISALPSRRPVKGNSACVTVPNVAAISGW